MQFSQQYNQLTLVEELTLLILGKRTVPRSTFLLKKVRKVRPLMRLFMHLRISYNLVR